jgi:hypothetical protein
LRKTVGAYVHPALAPLALNLKRVAKERPAMLLELDHAGE